MLANAQTQSSSSQLPPGVPHPGGKLSAPSQRVKAIAGPPAGFNVLKATAKERADNKVPPMPNKGAYPLAYAQWESAVAIPLSRTDRPTRRVAEVLRTTERKHGPAKGLTKVSGSGANAGRISGLVPRFGATNGTTNNVQTATSTNWSGPVDVIASKPFATGSVSMVVTVPAAHQPLNTCTGDWLYSSAWPGIDGWDNNDVFQAGIDADSYCSGGTTATHYSAWIEWFPDYSTEVDTPSLNPGDMVYIQVWNDTPAHGYAYFYNYATGVVGFYELNAPSGTTLVGNSAEWIVEAPTVDNNQSALMNYVYMAMPFGVAWNYTAQNPTYYWMGIDPAAINPAVGGTAYICSMVDQNNNVISTPYVENVGFTWFQNSGSSYQKPASKISVAPASKALNRRMAED